MANCPAPLEQRIPCIPIRCRRGSSLFVSSRMRRDDGHGLVHRLNISKFRVTGTLGFRLGRGDKLESLLMGNDIKETRSVVFRTLLFLIQVAIQRPNKNTRLASPYIKNHYASPIASSHSSRPEQSASVDSMLIDPPFVFPCPPPEDRMSGAVLKGSENTLKWQHHWMGEVIKFCDTGKKAGGGKFPMGKN
ncbi:hypothetical protein JTE90_006882 [Oedothorax gibbosus]|uniref:Uncharacterized protein n=1 Tax=Oedothorax gibbosus TaxID=931172 RepID=A0AAV6VQX3_9ARAC|nr:hypothetical protein JTE90_006882 [Oedothorax gibbosus]